MGNFDRVIPNLESCPEHVYRLFDDKIRVHKYEREEKLGGFLFEITLPDSAAALLVMQDLYYGEYTGG